MHIMQYTYMLIITEAVQKKTYMHYGTMQIRDSGSLYIYVYMWHPKSERLKVSSGLCLPYLKGFKKQATNI